MYSERLSKWLKDLDQDMVFELLHDHALYIEGLRTHRERLAKEHGETYFQFMDRINKECND